MRTLGGRLAWARAQRGLSQPALAEAAGVSQGTIGNLEAGIRKKPRELLAIAQALRLNPAWLETGKGAWDAATGAAMKGAVFNDLSEEEQALLSNFRAMLDEDQEQFAKEIAGRAAKMRAYTAKVLERVGGSAQRARTHADEKKTAAARAALEVTEELRQRALFDAPHSTKTRPR